MQYPAASDLDCSSGARAAMLDGSLSCLWPSNTPEDVIRRALAVILCEDPDHRLRVAHLEPLLHMALGPQQLPCSSGRLQALLTDPSTAKIFPVDFSAQVPDWRSRVVYLDMTQLTASLSSAKAHRLQQQQQQHADASGVDQDASATRLQRGSSSGCSESAALDSHLVGPDGDHSSTSVTDHPSQQHQQHAAAAASAGSNHNRPAPLALENIFGSSPAFSAGGPGLPAGRSSSQGGGAAAAGGMQAQPGQHHNSSSSMPAVTPKEPGSDSSHRGVSSSLFGGSFEVPYAIASCWATGNQAGRFGTAHSGTKGHPVLADTLAGAADGGGSSSLASASSTRSFAGPAAAPAGAAGAIPARPATGSSRLRNASSMQGGDGTAGEPAVANSIDVCTPRSGIAAPAGADRSPLLSSADCEEDAGEYSEAALVFGSVSNAAAGGAAVLAAAGGEDRAAAAGRAVTGERSASSGIGAPAADSAGQLEAEESFSMQGVDWSCMAGLQQQQQQQSEAAYHYQQQQAAQQQQQQQHQALLFGLDDFGADGLTPRSSGAGGPGSAAAHNSALAAAATGALTARRLLMEHAGLLEDTGSFHNPNVLLGSHHSPHHLAALASSLGALGSGSAPATLQQQQQHEQLLLAAAAAAGSGRGFGGYGHERLLLDPEGLQGYGLSGQQHMAALASSLQGGSYGSGGFLGSDRSLGSGFWASPAAMQQHFLMQQQQHHQRQQQQAAAAAAVAVAAAAAQSQQQQMRASLGGGPDGTIDTSFGIDQIGKADQQHPVGSAGTPGKGGALGASAFGRPAGSSQGGQQELTAERSSSSSIGAAPGASALTPRLTGWASVAAKEPPAGSGPQQQQAQSAGSASLQGGMKAGQAGSTGSAASKAGGADAGQGKAVAKLPPRVKAEVQHLVSQFQGVLKLEDFDDGVVHQLNAKRTEDEAVAAVRNIAHYELGTIQHMAAYLNHVVKNFNAAAAAAAAAAADTTVGLSNALAVEAAAAVAANSHAAAVHGGSSAATAATIQQLLGASMLGGNGSLGSTVGAGRGGPAAGAGGAAGLGAYGGQIRLTSVPVSTKAMLQKLPLKVFKQIELLVQNSAYLEWRHFDAGVIKVLSQLSKLCEGDVFEELELLAATDLSNVEYMPAYLNKRLNNKLWSRRKAEGHVPG